MTDILQGVVCQSCGHQTGNFVPEGQSPEADQVLCSRCKVDYPARRGPTLTIDVDPETRQAALEDMRRRREEALQRRRERREAFFTQARASGYMDEDGIRHCPGCGHEDPQFDVRVELTRYDGYEFDAESGDLNLNYHGDAETNTMGEEVFFVCCGDTASSGVHFMLIN